MSRSGLILSALLADCMAYLDLVDALIWVFLKLK